MARGGIEPPTRGFQPGLGGSRGLLINHLRRLPSSVPRPTQAQLRHTQSELGTSLASCRLSTLRRSLEYATEAHDESVDRYAVSVYIFIGVHQALSSDPKQPTASLHILGSDSRRTLRGAPLSLPR